MADIVMCLVLQPHFLEALVKALVSSGVSDFVAWGLIPAFFEVGTRLLSPSSGVAPALADVSSPCLSQ